jgi:hypothetical protein
MPGVKECTLCAGKVVFYYRFRNKDYYRCRNCHGVLLDPIFYLTPEAEKDRYDQHKNDPANPGYRKFVTPLVEQVQRKYPPAASGLDYGAGSGPVAAALLEEAGYRISLYDPYYWNDHSLLENSYEFIICCEVIEHFHQPQTEFRKLRSLLKPGGSIFCMTEMITDQLDFEVWYYKNDPTHVFFYHRDSLKWLKTALEFKSLEIIDRAIIFNL